MAESAIIELRGVRHAYTHGRVTEPVLHGVDLVVRAGEFVIIMGASGCGKSTLLNIIGLMMRPTQAEALRIGGADAPALSDGQRTVLRRRTVGFVFQRFNLLPTIDVRRNIALPLRIRQEAENGRVEALLDRTGLRAYAGKKPEQLSVGQQQRAAIARAVVTRPALLLADEPTGNLDSANASAVLELFRELHRSGQTILMITHNQQLAAGADRVLEMSDGRIVGQ